MMTPVYTAIFDSQDRLSEVQNTTEANFYAFMGKPVKSQTWVVGQGQHVFTTNKMNDLLYLFSSHVLFPRPKMSLWIKDVSLSVPVDEIVDKQMNGYDIGFIGNGRNFLLRRNTLEIGTFNDIAMERLTLGLKVDPLLLSNELELKSCLIETGVISDYDPISNKK